MKNYFLGILIITSMVFTFGCSESSSNEQNLETSEEDKDIEDYFLPESPNNKAEFSLPQSSLDKSRYYINKDTVYLIKDSSFIQGKPSNIETKTIAFVNDEVHVIQSALDYGFGKPSITEFNLAQIILKMPPQNETINWTTTDPMSGTINYLASWDEVTYANKKKSAIKVEKSFENTSVKKVEYYVEGVGLFKAVAVTSNGSIQGLKLEGVSHVSGIE